MVLSIIILMLILIIGIFELNGIVFYLKEWKLVLRMIIVIFFLFLKCVIIKNVKI